MYVVTVTQKLLGHVSYWLHKDFVHSKKKYISIPDPIEIRTLQIGDFAAQIENDPGGLIPVTMAGGDQRKFCV